MRRSNGAKFNRYTHSRRGADDRGRCHDRVEAYNDGNQRAPKRGGIGPGSSHTLGIQCRNRREPASD